MGKNSRLNHWFLIGALALLLLIAVPVWGANDDFFAKLCAKPKADLTKAACELRDRVMALENRRPSTQLHLFDGNNQDLGIVLDAYTLESDLANNNFVLDSFIGYTIFVQSENAVLLILNVPLWAGGEIKLLGSSSDSNPIAFDGSNCTGNAIAQVRGSFGTNSIIITPMPERRYFKYTNDIGTTRNILSEQHPELGCLNREEPYPTITYLLEEVTLPFSEPLAYPLEIRMIKD